MKEDFLLEIGTEELPARHCMSVVSQLKPEIVDETALKHNLIVTAPRLLVSPRRITLLARSISQKETDREIKGPLYDVAFSDGKPNDIAKKFASSQNIPVDNLIINEHNGKKYLFAQQDLSKKLPDQITRFANELLVRITVPRPMRWDTTGFRFSRPIRWVVCLKGKAIVPITLLDLTAGRETYGPRFLGSHGIALHSAAEYEETLAKNAIIADHAKRRKILTKIISTLASSKGLIAHDPENELLEETVFLAEYPQPLLCTFDEEFLSLPPEVIEVVLRDKQKYFPLISRTNDKLTNRFLVIANFNTDSQEIARGNETVVRARLRDAVFFYEQDSRSKLAEFAPKTSTITFQEKLGSMEDKSKRVETIAMSLANYFDVKPETVTETVGLLKADLATHMVTELPSLEGTIGRIYAIRDGVDTHIATAIEEQYLPRSAQGALPQTPLGTLFSLADRIDSIYGLFSIGQEPTGSSDPYGLRRAAIAILRILWENTYDVPLNAVISSAAQAYKTETVVEPVTGFILTRLEQFIKEQDTPVPTNLIRAVVFSTNTTISFKKDILKQLETEQTTDQFAGLLELAKRIHHIAAKEAEAAEVKISRSDLNESEQKLYDTVEKLRQTDRPAISDLYTLTGPGTEFFEKNLVMAEDTGERKRRLSILRRAHGEISRVLSIALANV
ncbi:MAG: glycine--tRNA ligase subunit beta [Candidatus Dojkabacteria bacterium]|nr:glycine--tRNA ligase subunit beta [Candidatus Dojkabacteria bacterium]